MRVSQSAHTYSDWTIDGWSRDSNQHPSPTVAGDGRSLRLRESHKKRTHNLLRTHHSKLYLPNLPDRRGRVRKRDRHCEKIAPSAFPWFYKARSKTFANSFAFELRISSSISTPILYPALMRRYSGVRPQLVVCDGKSSRRRSIVSI